MSENLEFIKHQIKSIQNNEIWNYLETKERLFLITIYEKITNPNQTLNDKEIMQIKLILKKYKMNS